MTTAPADRGFPGGEPSSPGGPPHHQYVENGANLNGAQVKAIYITNHYGPSPDHARRQRPPAEERPHLLPPDLTAHMLTLTSALAGLAASVRRAASALRQIAARPANLEPSP
ncbi:hypothetical protein [Kitasatospora sp. NPDC101183]|uniref:hypothetical protein n=1 Tax=Kitasatospora sp. NPDC101183 TaxID=3364100 RepID=UPI003801C3AF